MPPKKIIFDTDPGIDDAMALLFADRSPAIDLVGVTTVLGNASIDTVTRNALYLCERFDIPVPVHRGADRALLGGVDDYPTFVHGDDGLGNINPAAPAITPTNDAAATFIVDTIMANPNAITLVAVGRMTNLALALRLEPKIVERVQEVVIMGGALGSNEYTGNVTPVAEANIHGDPEAADIVLSADWPLVMVGLDVTMQTVMLQAQTQRIRQRAGEVGEFIWDISRFYENFYLNARGTAGFPMHDSSAIAYVINPELFTTVTGAIRVTTQGISRGQTILVPTGSRFPVGDWEHVSPSLGCIGVDAAALLTLYEDTMTRERTIC